MPLHVVRPAVAALLLATASLAHALPHTLPPEVELELERAQVPRQAMVVVVQEVGRTRTRLSVRPDEPVNPASLMKLITTLAALDLLGPAWTWTTPVWLQGNVTDGVLDGNLVIKGSGDPKLTVERLWLMLRHVQQLGVREIRGDIVLDRSAFSVPEQSPAEFDGEPLRPYNVRPDALMLNQKALLISFTPDAARGVALVTAEPPLAGLRIDASVPLTPLTCDDWRGALKADLTDPARIRFTGSYAAACGEKLWPIAPPEARNFNERVLTAMWRELGGKLGGSVRDGAAPTTRPTFELVSPPLAEVVRDINKYSNNVMAQQLFLTLGLMQRNAGTPEAAREVVRRWLVGKVGKTATTAIIDNGSGLSRDTRVSAALLARLLQAAWASPVMPELVSSLPIAGIDGTLRRARGATGRAHLKTGSLRDAAGLAGVVLGSSGRRYVVAAIINHPNANAARPALDALLQWTADDGPPPRSELQN